MKKSRREGLPPKPNGPNTRRSNVNSSSKKRYHPDILDSRSKPTIAEENPLDIEVGWDEEDCQTRKRATPNIATEPKGNSISLSSELGSSFSSVGNIRRFSLSVDSNNSSFHRGTARGMSSDEVLSQSYDSESAEDRARFDEILDMKIFALAELRNPESNFSVSSTSNCTYLSDGQVDEGSYSVYPSNATPESTPIISVLEPLPSISVDENMHAPRSQKLTPERRVDSVSSENFRQFSPNRFNDSQTSEVRILLTYVCIFSIFGVFLQFMFSSLKFKDPSQPDFIDSVIQYPVHGLSLGAQSLITGSSSSESSSSGAVSSFIGDLSLSKTSSTCVGIGAEGYSFDDCLSDDALKALVVLEAKAMSHLSQKKGFNTSAESLEPSNSQSLVNMNVRKPDSGTLIAIGSISKKTTVEVIEQVATEDAFFADNFDFDMLEALERQAMSQVLKKRQSQSSQQVSVSETFVSGLRDKHVPINFHRDTDPTVYYYYSSETVPFSTLRVEWLPPVQNIDSAISELHVRRFVALNVTNKFNENTKQIEKIIACYSPGK